MSEHGKQKGMCIATRCTSVDHFVEMFHRYVDEDSFFVSTNNTRPPGLETSFSVQLADGTPVLRGICVVLQAWTNATSPFKTPGVRLGIKRLTASSMPVFERLLITRSTPASPPSFVQGATTQVLETRDLDREATTAIHEDVATKLTTAPRPEETRTPGSDYILPANPLQNLTDESLEGYVDCTLYEETANYFPADETAAVESARPVMPTEEPPVFAPRPGARAATMPIELMPDEPSRSQPRTATMPPQLRMSTGKITVIPAPPGSPRTTGSIEIIPIASARGTDSIAPAGRITPLRASDSSPALAVAASPSPSVIEPAPPALAIVPPPTPSLAVVPPMPQRSVASDAQPPIMGAGEPTAPPGEWSQVPSAIIETAPTAEASAPPEPAGFTPAYPSEHGFPGRPPFGFASRDSSPSGEITSVPRASTPRRRKQLVVGGAAAAVAVVLALSFGALGSNDAENPAANAPAAVTPAEVITPIAAIAKPAIDTTDETAEAAVVAPVPAGDESDGEDSADGPSGTPVAGDGPCRIDVASTPAGSMVVLDGTVIAPSPITLATTCERHKIDIKHPRYKLLTKQVTPTKAAPGKIEVTLQRPTHTVSFVTQPAGATVFIDGRRAGTTPTTVNVLGFSNLKIEIKKPGFATVATRLYSKVAQDRFAQRMTKW